MRDDQLLIILLIFTIVIGLFLIIAIKKMRQFQDSLKDTQINQTQGLHDFKTTLMEQIRTFERAMNSTIAVNQDKSQNRMIDFERTLQKGLYQYQEKTNQSLHGVKSEVQKVNQTQERLDLLTQSMEELHVILNDKTKRGLYGEHELYSLLETVFGNNRRRFDRQVTLSNNKVADAVVYIRYPDEKVVIDSKFPLENYLKMHQNDLSPEEFKKVERAFQRDVLKHIKDIEEKYIIPYETVNIAFMFIPSEAIFAEIYGNFIDVVEEANRRSVFIVSASSLMAYLDVLHLLLLDQERSEHLIDIQTEYQKLADEFKRYDSRFSKVERDATSLKRDLDQLAITKNKIIKQFEAISALQIEKEDEK